MIRILTMTLCAAFAFSSFECKTASTNSKDKVWGMSGDEITIPGDKIAIPGDKITIPNNISKKDIESGSNIILNPYPNKRKNHVDNSDSENPNKKIHQNEDNIKRSKKRIRRN